MLHASMTRDLMEWWYAIYWMPLCLSLLWFLMTALSGSHGHSSHGGHGHAGHGGAGDSHAHAGEPVTHHFQLHHHAHGHEHVHGHDSASHHADSPQTFASRLMGLIGIGRVPIVFAVGLFLLFWGTFGLIANRMCEEAGLPPAVFVLPSLGAVFVATLIVTRIAGGMLGRIMPRTESYAITDSDLLGREGHVVYPVSEASGTVQVTDSYGTVHRRMAKTEPGASTLSASSPVIVVGVDDADQRLIVKEYGETNDR